MRPGPRIALGVLCLLAVVPGTSHAYLDPGTTSYVIQVLVAAFAGTSLAATAVIRRVRAVLSRKRAEEDAPKAKAPAQETSDAPKVKVG